MTTTTTSIPPQIIQYYSRLLLESPAKCNDDCETFARIYFYIKKRLMKKASHNPIWQERCAQLEKEFLELYERAKAKEKDQETKTKNKTQEPLYRIRFVDRRDEKLFDGFRYASYRTVPECWASSEI